MGLWSRLLARLLAFGNKLLSGFKMNNAEYTCSPPQKWREGVYFKWENTGMNPEPFALIQSGSKEYDNARRITSGSTTVHFSAKGYVKNSSLERKKREQGMEIIVPRTPAGVVRLCLYNMLPVEYRFCCCNQNSAMSQSFNSCALSVLVFDIEGAVYIFPLAD